MSGHWKVKSGAARTLTLAVSGRRFDTCPTASQRFTAKSGLSVCQAVAISLAFVTGRMANAYASPKRKSALLRLPTFAGAG